MSILTQKSFLVVYLAKEFWSKCTHSFCKINHFIELQKKWTIMKRSSLQKELINLIKNSFFGADIVNTFCSKFTVCKLNQFRKRSKFIQ